MIGEHLRSSRFGDDDVLGDLPSKEAHDRARYVVNLTDAIASGLVYEEQEARPEEVCRSSGGKLRIVRP